MSSTVWIIASAAFTALFSLLAVLRRVHPVDAEPELPTEWPLAQRTIFSSEERQLFSQLRQALPHHTILAKLPLVRFCYPIDRKELQHWFDLLSQVHVSFVVCSDNGRIIAALDVERPDRPGSRRSAQIKQAVLASCRIRYVKCRSDKLPSVAELQLLAPSQGEASRPVLPTKLTDPRTPTPVHTTLAESVRSRRGGPWRDSRYLSDSFFAPDGNDRAMPPELAEESTPMRLGPSTPPTRTPSRSRSRSASVNPDTHTNIPAAATLDQHPAPAPASRAHRSVPMPLRGAAEPSRAMRY